MTSLFQKYSLYIVATPIGNMGDITIRAIETLKNVDFIIAEDSREIQKILEKFNIKKKIIPYIDQNHNLIIGEILELIKSGQNAALVSDNGTPLISDPGYKLVHELQRSGLNVYPVPGASAITAALSVSGLPTDKFIFLGFLPKNPDERKELLTSYGSLDATLILYESPLRLKSLLQEILDILGDRQTVVAKDLTKLHESVINQRLTSHLNSLQDSIPKGEFVVLIAKENYGPDNL